MAQIPGTVVGSKIVPTDSADTYATHEAAYGKGGHRSVADNTARDAIPTDRREEGMTVYVQDTDTLYYLKTGIDNSDWVEFDLGGSGETGLPGATGPSGTVLSSVPGPGIRYDYTGSTGLQISSIAGYHDDFSSDSISSFWTNRAVYTSGDWDIDATNNTLEGLAQNNDYDAISTVYGDLDYTMLIDRNSASSVGFYIHNSDETEYIRFYKTSIRFKLVAPGYSAIEYDNNEDIFWIRITRIGNVFSGYFKIDENDEWTLVGSREYALGTEVITSLDSATGAEIHEITLIDNTKTDSGSSALTDGYVGYGSGSNTLTGEEYFTFDAAANHLNIGAAGAGGTGHGATGSITAQSLLGIGQLRIGEIPESIEGGLGIFCAAPLYYDNWILNLGTAGDAHRLSVHMHSDGTVYLGTDSTDNEIVFNNSIRLSSNKPTVGTGGSLYLSYPTNPAALIFWDGDNERVLSDGSRYVYTMRESYTLQDTTTERQFYDDIGAKILVDDNPLQYEYHRVVGEGILHTAGSSAGTLRFKLINIYDVITDTGAFTIEDGLDDVPFKIYQTFFVDSTGASGSIVSAGAFEYTDNSGNVIRHPMTTTTPATADLSGNMELYMTAQWGTASSDNYITTVTFYCKKMYTL